MSITLFVFRRDLRLEDNTALLQAISQNQPVLPIFIFDPRQLKKHHYHSQPAFQFMLESLEDLDRQLSAYNCQLHCFYGEPQTVIAQLIKKMPITAVYFNQDYTPFSRQRDMEITKVCQQHQVQCVSCHDALLTIPGSVLTQQQQPYRIFTPFFLAASKYKIALPKPCPTSTNFYQPQNNFTYQIDGGSLCTLEQMRLQYLTAPVAQAAARGGRKAAQTQLSNIKNLNRYAQSRNEPANTQSTSMLSAHHKFGTISVRETYMAVCAAFSDQHPLITEIYWRDFFTHIAFHYPNVFGQEFQEKTRNIAWRKNESDFERWSHGQTGFPIVDAGMRQLNATGYMHNRVRMIVASFLTKDLQLDWRLGEAYFAQKLIDYDPAVNNGNWQWAASTGADAQPYFRIFNPWRQQEKFDPQAIYIKQWLPELANLDAKNISKLQQYPQSVNYPRPMVDHTVAAQRAKTLFSLL